MDEFLTSKLFSEYGIKHGFGFENIQNNLELLKSIGGSFFSYGTTT